MKQKQITVLVLALMTLFIFEGCRSSKRAFNRGDYYQSCMIAIDKLRSNPEHKISREVLQQAYPLLIENTKSTIENTLTMNGDDKFRQIYQHYGALNTIYQNIKTCPGALKVIPRPQPFFEEQAKAKDKAFQECMELGNLKLSAGTHEEARQAYYLFNEALNYSPNNPQANNKIAEALDKATVKVVLEQIPVLGKYQFSCDFFYDQIFTYLNNDRRNQFLRFYRPIEAERIRLKPDHVIRMAFDDFVVGQIYETSNTELCKKDSVVVGTVKMDNGREKKVYNTVTAKLTTRTRTVESKGLLSLQIVDFKTKQLLAHEKLPGTFTWQNLWGNFNGDSRALTSQQLKICEREAVVPPPTQDLFIEFTKPIFTNTSNYLARFYKFTR